MASNTNLEALINEYKSNPESDDYQKTAGEEKAESEFNKYYSIKCIETLDGGDLAERLFSDSNSNPRGLFSWLEAGTKDVYGSAKPASCQVGVLYTDTDENGEKTIDKKYYIYIKTGIKTPLDSESAYKYAAQIKKALVFIDEKVKTVLGDKTMTEKKYHQLSDQISKELQKDEYHHKHSDIHYWYWNKQGFPNAFLLKYMYMSFPDYFACTYADTTLSSIVKAIGQNEGKQSNIEKNGIIARYAKDNDLEPRVLEKMLGKAGLYDEDDKANVQKDNHQHWVVVANREIYDHTKCFDEMGSILWEQNKTNQVKVGDVVFIKEAKGIIRWKTVVDKLDISISEYKKQFTSYEIEKKDYKSDQKFISLRLESIIPNNKEEAIDRCFPLARDNESAGKASLNNGKKPYEYKKGEGVNKIFYGTPGCGKSYHVQKILKDKSVNDSNIYRVTFYQDYSYSDFVGQIMPKIDKINKTLTYDFVPGPFTLALKKAIIEPDTSVALVIEELNRGNAPAIFGDLFQLLDRNDDGVSRYPIRNENIVEFVNEHLDKNMYEDIENVKIPSNLFLYATMNTSDQNVFTLDTAFKRRWKSEKISNEFKPEDDSISKKYIPGLNEITWEDFVGKINEHILEKATSLSSEDKQIGKYFVSENDLLDQKDKQEASKTRDFAYKVLEYLWDDVAKFNRSDWFIGGIRSLDQLINGYIEGKQVFINELEMKPCSVSGGPKETQEKSLSGTEAETTDDKDN